MRSLLSYRPFVMALFVVLVLAIPAFAEDAHGGGGEKKGGLEFTGIKRWDLGIYTLITFGLMIFILAKYAWPHIKTGLEKREQSIRGALDEARKDREDAKLALEQARKQLAETALQVKAMLDEARRDGEVKRAEEREAGVKDAQAARANAERQIAADRASLLKEVYEQAVKLAALMSETALHRAVSAEDHRRLRDESIAQLNQSANKA